MNKPNIKVILASIREGRRGEKVGQWVMDTLKGDDRANLELLDLKDYKLPYYEAPETPSKMKGKFTNPKVMDWIKKIEEADGFIIITPEYNHSYPAQLKTALDYPYEEWNKKAVGFISYGGIGGGVRSVEQLRLVAVELQMAPIESAVIIHRVKTFGESGSIDASFNKQLTGMYEDLLWWTNALKAARHG